jgi:hypothetical protein
MTEKAEEFKKIEAFLLEDSAGDKFVENLSLHALYLLGFELLKDTMDDYFRDLHADWHEEIDGKLEYVKYIYGINGNDKEVIKLSDNDKRNKKKLKKHFPEVGKLFNGEYPNIKEQIEEAVELEIFTKEEGESLKGRYRLLRNGVGHELLQMLLRDNFKEASWNDVMFMHEMCAKLERWIYLNYTQTIYYEPSEQISEKELTFVKSFPLILFEKSLEKVTTHFCD